jgi:hypothetical protein
LQTAYLLLLIPLFRAGAHWRTHAKKEDLEQQSWDIETYHAWTKLVDEEKGKKTAGVVLKDKDISGIAVRITIIRPLPNILTVFRSFPAR